MIPRQNVLNSDFIVKMNFCQPEVKQEVVSLICDQ